MAATATATFGVLAAAQAQYALRRRDLPCLEGLDASGVELAGLSSVSPTSSTPQDRIVRLVAMGDSTLTGPGLADPSRIWIRQVARAISREQHVSIDVASVARLGARVHDVLDSQVATGLGHRPEVVVVAVGTNDAVHATPLRVVERHFDELARRLADAVPAVVFGGVGNLGGIVRVPFPLSSVARARGRQLDRIVRSAAAAHGVGYIDVSSVDSAFRVGGRAVFSADLYHPNESGHALWAHAAAPVVAHAVRSVLLGTLASGGSAGSVDGADRDAVDSTRAGLDDDGMDLAGTMDANG